MGQALQNYEQRHNLHALQVATGSCQVRLEEQGGEDFARTEPPTPLAAPPQMGGRRNIGCGWWPIGSDADRDCAAESRFCAWVRAIRYRRIPMRPANT